MTEPLLEIRHLVTQLRHEGKGWLPVVDDVSLRIDPGEVVGLVGESGCGKSMTAFSIMRLFPTPAARVASGQVLLKGRDLLGLSADEMRQVRGAEVGMIFQDPSTFLDPLHTLGDQIAEPLRAHNIPGDPRARALELIDLMRDLRAKTGAAMLLITHDLGVVAEMCDRVYVMYAGRIVERNSTAQLFKSPRHPYTQGLLGSTLSLETSGRKLFAIPGSIPSATQMPAGCRFAPRCPIAADACRVATPELLPLDGGEAACHRLDQTAGDVWARTGEEARP